MLTMYTRLLALPKHSFFLFGPRGTGKTTWLKTVLKEARWFDLLRSSELLKLMRNPGQFRLEVEALAGGSWVVVDEIQKWPLLLNEIHSLIADYPHKYQFALSGSSARKLKRLDSNLLAGRVINRKFFPLTGAELNYDFDPDNLLKYGTLPKVCADPENRVDILEAYVVNYINENHRPRHARVSQRPGRGGNPRREPLSASGLPAGQAGLGCDVMVIIRRPYADPGVTFHSQTYIRHHLQGYCGLSRG
jgi:predicted AAA+ superfamily ATPase